MIVHSVWLKSLLGPNNQDEVSFLGLCSEHTMAESKRWFDQATNSPGQWRETHLLDFLRRCTDLCDAQILSIFDLLDPDGRGSIGFLEFYYLVLLLMALKEGQMKVFLYQRLDMTCALLQALSVNESDEHSDSKAPGKIMFAHVCMMLRPFGLENLLPSVLAELRFTVRREIAIGDAHILFFALANAYDEQARGNSLPGGHGEATARDGAHLGLGGARRPYKGDGDIDKVARGLDSLEPPDGGSTNATGGGPRRDDGTGGWGDGGDGALNINVSTQKTKVCGIS